MSSKKYYEILGVSKTATQQEIKKAYKKLAKMWHPDVNKAPNADAKFKELGEAYDVLGNKDKRREYDESLASPTRRPFSAAGGSRQSTNRGGDFRGFSQETQGFGGAHLSEDELMSLFFGARENVQAQLDVTLEQAYKGEKVQVQAGDKSLNLSIPARANNGSVLHSSSEFTIILRIAPHDVYELKQGDLLGVLQVAPWQAVLGGTAKLFLPDGAALNLKIPAGAKAGKKLRIPGKGLRRENGELGAILLEIEIVVPDQTSVAEKELYQRLAEKSSFRAGVKTRSVKPKKRAAPVG